MKLDTPRAKIEMLGMIHPGPSPMLPENGSLTVSLPTVGSSRPACVAVDWGLVVARVKNGEDGATEQLYKLSNKGIRYNIFLHLGSQDLEDKVHDIFLIVVNAIRGSHLRKPDRLMGFVLGNSHLWRSPRRCLGDGRAAAENRSPSP